MKKSLALRALLALRVVAAFVDRLIDTLATIVAVEEAASKGLDVENTKRYQAKIVQGLVATGTIPAIEYTKSTRAKRKPAGEKETGDLSVSKTDEAGSSPAASASPAPTPQETSEAPAETTPQP